MDGEGEIDLKKLNICELKFSAVDRMYVNSYSPQWTIGEDERVQMWKEPAQSHNFRPVCDWISIQM